MKSNTLPASEAISGLPPGTCILQVLPALGHGGVERGTVEIARAIVEAGGRALVVSGGGPNVQKLQRAGGEHVEMPVGRKTPWAIAANRRRLAALIEDQGVSLVHARSRAPAWAARGAARQAGRPFVTTYHGAYNEGSWFKKRYNRVMASGDRVIAISDFIAQLIRRRYGTPAEVIRTIHRGADLSVFDPAAVPGGRLGRLLGQWAIPETARIVLLPARLTRWKGQELLLRAFAEIHGEAFARDAVLVFAGGEDGDTFQGELETLARKLRIDPMRVRFPGHCDDMAAAMMLATVVVSASIEPEAFGRTVAEAGAMAKPVIAPNHGAAPEIVREGETGWLVPPGDARALSAALSGALRADQADLAAMGQRAQARVREHFSVAAMQAQTLAVYRELLEPAGAARP